MSSYPKISIITPVFNGVMTIERAMKSILEQSYPDIEWIIIDGGSTDGTIEFLKENPSDKIKWTSGPDDGIFDAMNKGVRSATGEWLYFLGVDDYLYQPSVLQEIFADPTGDADILYGDVYSHKLKRRYDGPTSREKILFTNLCHQSIFYKKSVFTQMGEYSLEYKFYGDWEFNLRCFFNKELHIEYRNCIVAYYSDGGSSAGGDIRFIRNFLFPFNLNYLNEKGNGMLRNITNYDRWWRLLRSLKLEKGIDEAFDYSNGIQIPRPVKKMIKAQSVVSDKLLWNGFFSKTFMFWNYIF